jgi:hypothetical protein
MFTASHVGLTDRGCQRRVRRWAVIVCTECVSDALCDRCYEQAYSWLSSTASVRGQRWATLVAERMPRRRFEPWPRTAKARAIALRKVADMTSDPRLRERLADVLEDAAARTWTRGY